MGPRRRFRATWRRVIVGLLGMLGVIMLAVAAYVATIPIPNDLMAAAPAESTRILDRNGRLLAEIPAGGYHDSVAITAMPPALIDATLAAEDISFFSNPGVDPGGIVRALFLDVQHMGGQLYGGSTLTQQLVRNLLLTPDERRSTSVTRKIHEAALAIRLTRLLPKSTILALYLNNVYYGNLAYGVDAASEIYFGRPVNTLDLAQAALLAGLPRAPSLYDPLRHLEAAKSRQHQILHLMIAHGLISASEEHQAMTEALIFVSGVNKTGEAPHFIAYVLDVLEGVLGTERVRQGGLTVRTSLDLDLQHQAERIVARRVAALADHNAHNGALVAIDPRTGEVLALVGSAAWHNARISGEVDVALSQRQPGSAIKPFTYVAAFQDGLSPATVIADVPRSFPTKEGTGYTPQNYDLQFHGMVSLRVALASSLNVPSVALLQRVGLAHMLGVAHAMGITTMNDAGRYGLSLTLGGGEVRLFDLTSAYGVLATGGVRHPPLVLLDVRDATGHELLEGRSDAGGQVLGPHGPQIAYLITDILSDPAARLIGFGEGSQLELPGREDHFGAAVKTGTTTDWRDNWTVGYTPDLVVGAWVGNADNSPMRDVSGVTGAAPIWHDMMQSALQGKPARSFARPPGLHTLLVCADSGKLPGLACPHLSLETFLEGQEPRQTDASWQYIKVDSVTGQAATAHTPASRVVSRLYRIFPPEAQAWARANGYPVPPLPGDEETGGGRTPALVLSSPSPLSVYQISPSLPRGDQRILLSAEAPDGAVRKLSLTVDGQIVGTFSGPPYSTDWILQPGVHDIAVVGWDSSGRRMNGQSVRITVTMPDNG